LSSSSSSDLKTDNNNNSSSKVKKDEEQQGVKKDSADDKNVNGTPNLDEDPHHTSDPPMVTWIDHYLPNTCIFMHA